MSKYISFWAVLFLVSLLACDEYAPDPIDPRLPKYSEAGKNTAGALINGTPWRTGDNCTGLLDNCEDDLRLTSYINGTVDSVEVSIWGRSDTPAYQGPISFMLRGIKLESLDDISKLKGIYGLTSTSYEGYFKNCSAQRGRLEIRHASAGASSSSSYILSGTFSLYTEGSGCEVVAVEWGRFDFEIYSGTNFHIY